MLATVVNIWPDAMMAFRVACRANNNQICEIIVFSSSIQMMDLKNGRMFVVLTVSTESLASQFRHEDAIFSCVPETMLEQVHIQRELYSAFLECWLDVSLSVFQAPVVPILHTFKTD